jgi:hypothetical protein
MSEERECVVRVLPIASIPLNMPAIVRLIFAVAVLTLGIDGLATYVQVHPLESLSLRARIFK